MVENGDKKKNNIVEGITETIDFNATACKYKHESIDKRINNIEDKLNVEITKFTDKIEKFDEKVRGDGDIGMEEEIRNLNEKTENIESLNDLRDKKVDSLCSLKNKIYLWIKIIKYILYGIIVFIIIIAGGTILGFQLPEKISNGIKRSTIAFFYDPEKEKKDKEQLKILIKEVLKEDLKNKEDNKITGKELEK